MSFDQNIIFLKIKAIAQSSVEDRVNCFVPLRVLWRDRNEDEHPQERPIAVEPPFS